MAFGCIFIPNFMVQAVMRSEPELRERAVALVDGTPPVWSVVGVNEAAARAGIQLGMTKSQAQQFCDIEIRHRSRAQEKAAHAALMDLGWSVSPRVEDNASDTIILDLSGLNSLFGADETIVAQFAERALRLGLSPQIAAASKIDAAIIAARGWAGVTVIPEGEEAKIIGGLPVKVLSPSEEILDTFERWGVRTCAALTALPVLQLSERLGQEGIRLHELARGESERSMVLAEPEVHFEEEMGLENAVEELEPLSFLLGRLLDQLCARLNARSLAACSVRVRFELDPGFEAEVQGGAGANGRKAGPKIYERILSLAVPMRDSKMLLKLVRLHLQADAPRAPILKIFLAADAARPRVIQGGLFLPSSPDPEKLELTVARLANLVGDANVGSPELMNTHRPGEFRMRRFVYMSGFASTNPEPLQLRYGAERRRRPLRKARVTKQVEERFPNLEQVNHPSGTQKVSLDDTRHSVALCAGLSTIAAPRLSEHFEAQNEMENRPSRANVERGNSKTKTAFRVFRPALPAEVDLREGCPARISFQGKHGRVVAASGPWRSSGDWWREDGWHNDEWDLEIEFSSAPSSRQCGFYRVFYDAIRQAWFVRGAYD